MFSGKAERMIGEIKGKYSLESPEVYEAMLAIPREKFVPEEHQNIAYDDKPVPIGYGQTMSQPFTVALMTDLLIRNSVKGTGYKNWKVLEIGTGSGYQAAVLSMLVQEVNTVEIVDELCKMASEKLQHLGFDNVRVKCGSGEYGWQEGSPYDGVLVTAGIEGDIPQKLLDQLKVGGVIVAPVGEGIDKTMVRITKRDGGELKREEFGTFRFVPFVERGS
jgi:protein-L-isoaspartate(D-aspartate) O-methyltransferase